MFKNIVNGFMKVMNSVKAAFEESYNGNYAGWNEGEELLMLNNIRAGVQWKHLTGKRAQGNLGSFFFLF